MFKNFIKSAKMFKTTRVLCASAIMTALYVALYAAKLQITPQLRISFSYIPLALTGWLFGTVPAVAVGAAGDIIGALLFPSGAYFPGFTLSAILSGAVFGILLFGENKMPARIVAAKAVTNFAIHALLGSFWISLITGKGFTFYFAERLLKNILSLPAEVILLYIIIKFLSARGVKKMYK